jgi:hypothetical protein
MRRKLTYANIAATLALLLAAAAVILTAAKKHDPQPYALNSLAQIRPSVRAAFHAEVLRGARRPAGPEGPHGPPGQRGPVGPSGARGPAGESEESSTKKLCEAIETAYANASAGGAVEEALDEIKNNGC